MGLHIWCSESCDVNAGAPPPQATWNALAIVLIIVCATMLILAYRGFWIIKRFVRRSDERLVMFLHDSRSPRTLDDAPNTETKPCDVPGDDDTFVSERASVSQPPPSDDALEETEADEGMSTSLAVPSTSFETRNVRWPEGGSPSLLGMMEPLKDMNPTKKETLKEEAHDKNGTWHTRNSPFVIPKKMTQGASSGIASMMEEGGQVSIEMNERIHMKDELTQKKATESSVVASAVHTQNNGSSSRAQQIGTNGQRRTPRRAATRQRPGSPSGRTDT
eukprot:2724639-Pleurochrysis_carterae.AAC.1